MSIPNPDLHSFLARLQDSDIYYDLASHREGYVMVKVAIPGERWEVEFTAEGEVEIEVFSQSSGVRSDPALLEDIFTIHDGLEFVLSFQLRPSADAESLLSRFVTEAIEAHGLAVGGNPLADDGCVISMYARGSVSEELRQRVIDWLGAQQDIISYQAGPLGDLR